MGQTQEDLGPLVLPGEGLVGKFGDEEISGKEALMPHLHSASSCQPTLYAAWEGPVGFDPSKRLRCYLVPRVLPWQREGWAIRE